MILTMAVCIALPACTLSRQHYVAPDVAVGEPAFTRAVEAHTLSGGVGGNHAELLVNGEQIFPAMLAAIRGAKTTITFANFLWEKGDIGRDFAEALAERCRAGVGVNVLVDAVGSSHMPKEQRRLLKASGCHFARYHSLNPFALKRLNHRNHRRVLVVDGRIGFTGGTGIGEKWTGDGQQSDHWRQTDVRVEGPIVRFIQSAFAENWRDATGVLLSGDAYFPPLERRGDLAMQSVKSSPAGGAAEAYLMFLLAIDGARTSIKMTNPYFVPDGQMAQAMEQAAERGVDVQVITAGAVGSILDRLVRKASQAHYDRALEAGVKIYEYGPGLLHAKTLVIDDQWVSIGSANFDNRSFALNNELNVTALDRSLARRLTRIFEDDLRHARPVSLADWRRHGLGYVFYLPMLPLRDQL
ncbi:MAG TPA: phospholipase D-like domain-containing protein [Methylomirabilota bacterium]|nr:phospholipase D-like domain-containing protein [Methylomirabilota bacterium]